MASFIVRNRNSSVNQSNFDRNVLFGILALHVDLIDGDQLVAATAKWAAEKARPLDEILVEQGALTAKLRDALEPMVAAHVERHGGDPTHSLASLSSTEQVFGALHRVATAAPELQAGLSHLGSVTVAIAADTTVTSRRQSSDSTSPDRRAMPFRSGDSTRSSSASSCGGLSTSATPLRMPTVAACCIAT
jgi:hypothetical protein